jgi:hypothetical protein
MSITKAQLITLRAEMNAAFEKAGLSEFTAEVSHMKYGDTDVTVKVIAKLSGVKSSTDVEFERKVAEYGLRMVGSKGEKLTGYNGNRPKYPFSYETVRGARYKQTVSGARTMFG